MKAEIASRSLHRRGRQTKQAKARQARRLGSWSVFPDDVGFSREVRYTAASMRYLNSRIQSCYCAPIIWFLAPKKSRDRARDVAMGSGMPKAFKVLPIGCPSAGTARPYRRGYLVRENPWLQLQGKEMRPFRYARCRPSSTGLRNAQKTHALVSSTRIRPLPSRSSADRRRHRSMSWAGTCRAGIAHGFKGDRTSAATSLHCGPR